MINLRKTETGIYYLYDYYPTRYRRITEEQENLRRAVWAYKKQEDGPMNRFTHELMEAIAIICQQVRSDKIGLVAVPPSKVKKGICYQNEYMEYQKVV